MRFARIFVDRRSAAVILLIALAVLGAFAPRARAQAVAIAEIDGYVTDPSGQAIVGAQVKATNVDEGQVRNTVSEATGRYAMPDLPVGNYKLEVSAAGFKTYVQTGITLQVASNVTINVPMQIGAVTESIRVEANAAMVETKENAVAQVIDTERMIDLPLNGRNPTQLLTLTGAGTSNMTLNGGDLTGSKNIQGTAGGSGQFSVAGSQANGINFLLDGGDNNDAFSNVALPIPFPGRGRRIQRAGQRSAGAVWPASRRRGQRGDQVGRQCVPRRPVRVSPQRRSQRPAEGHRDRKLQRRSATRCSRSATA